MYSSFFKLEPEKQTLIINAATREFATNGYRNASTNEIVKAAEISKGILFHYFKNKKQLYLFLLDHLSEVLVTEYFQKPWREERDFFERMKSAAITKLELFRKYPLIFKFFLTAYSETDSEVKADIEAKKQATMAQNLPNIYENIDLSNIKDEIDPKMALNLIGWALEGYANSKVHEYKTMSEKEFSDLVTEMDAYLEIMKKAFYKN